MGLWQATKDNYVKTWPNMLGPFFASHKYGYTNALKRSRNLNFNSIDLKIDMHANGAIGRNFDY